MELYHGTDLESANAIFSKGINVLAGNESADFGPGFYTTPNRDFAVERAVQKSRKTNNPPALVVITFNEEAAKGATKTFYDTDLNWLQFVVNNRVGLEYVERHNLSDETHNLDRKYPIVVGQTADVKVVYLIGVIEETDRLVNEEDLYVGQNPAFHNQYSFHNSYGLSFIEGEARIELLDEGDELK